MKEYSLEELFSTLSEEEKELRLGKLTDDPLREAFSSKRVIHAGLGGRPLSGEEAIATWNELLEGEAPKGLMQSAYIHIPFCQTKCLYCGFFQHASKQEIEDQYVTELIKEIEEDSKKRRIRDGLIQAVFIGGGTPTSLSAENAERLLWTIKNCLPLSNDYELTLEGRIHDCVPEKMDVWFKEGVNRISLGVQSFHTKIRRQVGRLDDTETIFRRLEELKAYNQASIIVDLIYGLPDQSMEKWMADIAMVEASAADGMDLYQLNVYENSDLQSAIEKGNLSRAATTSEQALMYEAAVDYLSKRDFKRLSACHWSRSIRERSMYNTMAKRGYPMFAFGCGAGGNIDGYGMMMHRALMPYHKWRNEGKKPIMALMKQSELKHITDVITDQLERLRLDLQSLIDLDSRLAGLSWLYEEWEKRGLVRHNGQTYELTRAGEFWYINITQTTLECAQYLITGETAFFKENIAAQDGRPAGHPEVKSDEAPKGHPGDMPKGHPAHIPMDGKKPMGHPAHIPMGGKGGHPAHIPMTGHPEGVPKGHPMEGKLPLGHPPIMKDGKPLPMPKDHPPIGHKSKGHGPMMSAMGLKVEK